MKNRLWKKVRDLMPQGRSTSLRPWVGRRQTAVIGGLIFGLALLGLTTTCFLHRYSLLSRLLPVEALDHFPYGTTPVSSADVECVMWKTESEGLPCTHVVSNAETGFCVLRDKKSGKIFKIMETSPGTFYQRRTFSCEKEYLDFINFRVGANWYLLQEEQGAENGTVRLPSDVARQEDDITDPAKPSRGIVMAAYDEVLPSAYAVIRQLRRTGCDLPIELWSREDELQSLPSVLADLVTNYNVTVHKIADSRVTGFFVKIYAMSNSAFDQLLFLDSDNVPVRDPTFLFETDEFKSTGALFWPDYWHPGFSIFDTGPGGLAWELFGVEFRNEMEQESGQVVVDRRKAARALSLISYYTNHIDIVLRLRALWGDKDMFRLAFRRTSTPYHMISTLPAIAGRVFRTWLPVTNDGSNFCGQTMIQHDPTGDVLFLHRNTAKLHKASGRIPMWEKMQKFTGSSLANYTVKIGPKRLMETCWYLPHEVRKGSGASFLSPRYLDLPFRDIEERLIEDVERVDALQGKLGAILLRWSSGILRSWVDLRYGAIA